MTKLYFGPELDIFGHILTHLATFYNYLVVKSQKQLFFGMLEKINHSVHLSKRLGHLEGSLVFGHAMFHV